MNIGYDIPFDIRGEVGDGTDHNLIYAIRDLAFTAVLAGDHNPAKPLRRIDRPARIIGSGHIGPEQVIVQGRVGVPCDDNPFHGLRAGMQVDRNDRSGQIVRLNNLEIVRCRLQRLHVVNVLHGQAIQFFHIVNQRIVPRIFK